MLKNYSIIRRQEYIELKNLNLAGKILDLGGSKKSGYHELLNSNSSITTVNIDSSYGCDLIFDIQEKFSLADNEFDYCLALNVLEHIFNFQNVFQEANRVLKPNGKFIFAVPFMHQIHGSPDDYFRYTKSSLIKLLEQNNFSEIEIKELGFGLFSLIFSLVGGSLPICLRPFFMNCAIIKDKICSVIFGARYQELKKRIPLGYFVVAKKLK
jgi:SAM-dependent methyltransferase